MRRERGDEPRWVSQLIHGNEWDKAAVRRHLEGEDMETVLVIPLSKHRIRDRIVWNHTKSGVYITSSGYLMTREMRLNGELGGAAKGEPSGGVTRDEAWKELWGLSVPPRV
ncbi:hypothetical protein LIER_38793 [Lithospermum erythrorhizon]|uniref:Uncharacterized protein n=1 Tax=Lithospermum erythrorhizon TaxID=34254 RepID=A0AAV3Q8Z7_LITER